jgi:uncharacterized protein
VAGRRTLGAALALAGLLVLGAPARGDAAPLPPAPARWLTDQAGVLSAAAAAEVDRRLEAFEQEQGTQILVVIYRFLPADAALEDWTQRVAEAWGVGRREHDDGAVLFVFVDARELRIEVGYGLEGALTDLESKTILEEVLIPRLRAGDWDGGIGAAADALMAAVRGEYRPDPATSRRQARAPAGRLLFLGLLIAFVLLSALTSRRGRRRLGGRGGWGGGSRGGGFGGGGFSGGGFSGGGGSFGGGGASGRW